MARLAVIGAGMMGEALARGLLAAGWTPSDLILADVRTDRLDVLAADLGVGTAGDNAEAASKAEAVLLAVKPQDAPAALESLRHTGRDLGIVSIVAGLRTQEVEERVGSEPSVVRAMPNTPARVGKGVTALTRGRYTLDATAELASAVFSTVGPVVWTAEHHLDAVTALSGSGPAYVFLVAEALIDAGVLAGLPRDVSTRLAIQTLLGSARLLAETGETPEALRAGVTSPGGTTAAGQRQLERAGVRSAILEAVAAATARSKELGR